MSDLKRNDLPPLEWLRVFEAAARCGGFTAAAREIGLTQAAVSQRIQALEARLGVPLFQRQRRGVQLTANGEAYVPHVRDALDRLRRSTSDLFGTPRKRLSIAAPASVSTLWIAPRLKRLARDCPGLEISLSSIHRDLDYDAAETDYQVRFGHGNWPGLEARSLYREVLAPAASPALAESVSGDWRSLPTLAIKGARDGWAEWAAALGEAPVRTPHLRFDSFITALEAAAAGTGMILASLPLAIAALRSGAVVRLTDRVHTMNTGAWLVWPQDQPKGHDHDVIVHTLCTNDRSDGA